MRRLITFCTLAVLILAVSPAAQADLIGVVLGTDPPPATISSYTMTSFPLDPQFTGSPYSTVTSVASPLGGQVTFSYAMDHRRIGDGWATWSHGYTGDVYFTGTGTTTTLTLPGGTLAFYLYAEPNPFETWLITATDQYGSSFLQLVDGSSGAKGFGFYVNPGSGQIITTMKIDYAGGGGFGVGEFGIARVPVPGAVLLGILGLSVAGVKLRKFA